MLNVWVNASGTEIIDRQIMTGDKEYNAGEWYVFNKVKYKLGDISKDEERLTKINNGINKVKNG